MRLMTFFRKHCVYLVGGKRFSSQRSSCYCAIGEGQCSSTPAKGGNQVTEIRARVHALKQGVVWEGGGENAPTTTTTESVAAAVRLSGYFAVVSAAGRSVCSHFIIPQHITLDVTGKRNNEKRLRRRIRFQGGWLHKQKRIKRRRQRLFLQELLLS
jgi:hypothetical protein